MVMKKIQSLQLLVYVAFGLLIFQSSASDDALRGFRDGLIESFFPDTKTLISAPPLNAIINGSFITHTNAADLKVDDKYLLQNISIYTTVKVNPDKIPSPVVLTWLNMLMVFVVFVILVIIARTINKVIRRIVEGSMFDIGCIKLINRIGLLMLLYALADFAFQEIDYYRQIKMIHAPLQVVNTTSFNFMIIITAILVFIIAEAFKQGARLKDEQSLTI